MRNGPKKKDRRIAITSLDFPEIASDRPRRAQIATIFIIISVLQARPMSSKGRESSIDERCRGIERRSSTRCGPKVESATHLEDDEGAQFDGGQMAAAAGVDAVLGDGAAGQHVQRHRQQVVQHRRRPQVDRVARAVHRLAARVGQVDVLHVARHLGGAERTQTTVNCGFGDTRQTGRASFEHILRSLLPGFFLASFWGVLNAALSASDRVDVIGYIPVKPSKKQ